MNASARKRRRYAKIETNQQEKMFQGRKFQTFETQKKKVRKHQESKTTEKEELERGKKVTGKTECGNGADQGDMAGQGGRGKCRNSAKSVSTDKLAKCLKADSFEIKDQTPAIDLGHLEPIKPPMKGV